ncbi:MAG: adenine phosphoribosyltransferase [bacterium]|nr:adenine phosphoribosyltransferase [bacterium]
MNDLKKYVRSVPDFPKKGVRFYDITSLLEDPSGFKMALGLMEEYLISRGAEKILAIESRGFIFGAALADRLNLPLAVVRKPGKLPGKTVSQEYDLEYGTDRIEIHEDAISKGEKIAIVDDLIATGGTLSAACRLVERLGGEIAGISTVIALPFLPYEKKLKGYDYNYLVAYDSE